MSHLPAAAGTTDRRMRAAISNSTKHFHRNLPELDLVYLLLAHGYNIKDSSIYC
jgi:hypothetical protein